MLALKARVRGGHIVVDAPTELPEGTELYVVLLDEELEDRLDIQEAGRVVAEMKAKGEQPLTLDELKRQLGL